MNRLLEASTMSYAGVLCGPRSAAIDPHSVAVQQGRLCRWAGAGVMFWPVLLHSMAVAAIVSQKYRFYALTHDATEPTMGDVPRPFKCGCFKDAEILYATKLWGSFDVLPPSETAKNVVKCADDAVLAAEVWVGIGPPALRVHFPDRDLVAEDAVREVRDRYRTEDYLSPGGRAVADFLHLFGHYKGLLQ